MLLRKQPLMRLALEKVWRGVHLGEGECSSDTLGVVQWCARRTAVVHLVGAAARRARGQCRAAGISKHHTSAVGMQDRGL